jgi:hypothetical protein
MWCSDISPACIARPTAFVTSTSTAISWPRESRLSLWKVSTCGSWSILWLPGITCM